MTIRQHIEEFVRPNLAPGKCFSISWISSNRRKCRRLESITVLTHDVDEVVERFSSACKDDLKKNPPEKSKAFFILRFHDPTASHTASKRFSVDCTSDDAVHARCDDCRGSGWYVGLAERRHCPTCDGSGYL